MSLTLSTVDLASLADAREARFARLGEGPELFLELRLRSAVAHRIGWHGAPAGYCLRGADGLLAELELDPRVGLERSAIFGSLVDRLALQGAWCLSFDPVLRSLGAERGWSATVDGTLFRALADERGPGPTEAAGRRLRPAVAADVDVVVAHRAGVFDDEDQCREWIRRDRVSVLEREGEFLGVGLLTRVWPTRPEQDVGVMVHPDHRRRGHASFVLRSLKRRCLDLGMRPTAGCDARNVASARALRRAGFVATHSLGRLGPRGGG
jgi:GNAT superfamily N-acetyltransferase